VTDNFGELLRAWRKEKGFTQAQLSEKSEKHGPKAVSQSTISQTESGRFIPSKRIVLQLAATLGLDENRINQFLVAARYGPSSDFDYEASRALRRLTMLLSDPIVTPLLEPLGDEVITAFIEAWEAHAQAKKAQYKRDWHTMREVADGALAKLWSASEQLAAYLHNTIGVASLHLGDLSGAEEAYFQAANLIQSKDDPYLQGMVLTHLGEVHRDRSEWKEALAKFEAALKEFSDLGDEMKVDPPPKRWT
jgi:transcriptional regulator with XRE-family HTH domain